MTKLKCGAALGKMAEIKLRRDSTAIMGLLQRSAEAISLFRCYCQAGKTAGSCVANALPLPVGSHIDDEVLTGAGVG
jgi:hypothetical protein